MSGPTITKAVPQIPKSKIRHPTFVAEAAALLLILLLAAWLRLGWPGVNSFGFDEARVSDMALQMAREGKFAALGMQSSTGVPNFAATVWFFALPYAVSTNPLVATSLVALLNVLAVAGVWWLGRAAWGKTAGLVAALLFAASPYLVFYGRSIWSQNLLAPFAVLWAVAIVAGLKNENPWWIGLHAFLAGFTGQIHFAGFALALASLWIGFRFRLWRWWTAVTAGLLLAVLAAVPTVNIIWRNGDGAKAVIRDLVQTGTATAADRFAAWRQIAQLSLSQGWEKFWLNAEWTWPPALAVGLQIASLLAAALIVVGAVWVGWQMVRDLRHAWQPRPEPLTAREILNGFVLVWALAAPLLFMIPRTPVYPQYQLVGLPAVFLLAGAAAALWPKRGWQTAVTLTAVFIAIFQVTAVAQTLTTVADTFVPGGMGTPLQYPQTAVRQLMHDGRPVVVETFGDIPEFDGDAAIFKVLLWGYPRQIVDARHVLLIPSEPAHLLFTSAELPAWEVATAVGLAGTVQELPRRQGDLPFMALTVDEVKLKGFEEVERPYQLANGAKLLGWQVQDLPESNQIRLITHWQITGEPQAGHFQQFNHLYLPGKDAPGQVQDAYTSSRAWQQGDHLITWVEFDRPAEPPAYFHVGMYTWPDLQRSPVLNREGVDPLYPIEIGD
ncbi:MAG: hypothetical protein H6659_00130 [Ardenticatenaceae bacterium]|nr:hypothetical protein [Ardenticatenaceae bacterium]